MLFTLSGHGVLYVTTIERSLPKVCAEISPPHYPYLYIIRILHKHTPHPSVVTCLLPYLIN